MERMYPYLSSPITIGNVTFRNRMFAAPVGGAEITPECTMNRVTNAFYELRAMGGAAAVTASECMVHPETDASLDFHIDTVTPGSLAGFAHTADNIARHGAVPSLELSHSGQYAGTYLTDKSKKQGLAQWGACDGVRDDGVAVKGLSEEQLEDIIAAYGNAAKLAKQVGYRMLMVHAGHGWLLNQFLSPYFNKRKDDYGGSLENRVRLTSRVLDAVREAVGPGFPIELRMSGSELFEGGYDLDEGIRIAEMLDDKVDLFHVSAGTYQRGFSVTHPSAFREHGCNVYLAENIKKHVSTPVATLGGLTHPDQMEAILEEGRADVVEMARALMADPFLPRKTVECRPDEIVQCLRCFVCMAERPVTATRRCAINPVIGRELDGVEVTPVPESRRKRVLVVGGGPAGLTAARVAAQRGHDVTLCDANEELGGLCLTEKATPFKREMYELGGTLALLARKAGAKLRTSVTVDARFAEDFRADAVIVAVGSHPRVPVIDGVDGEHVITVNDYYKHPEALTDEVAVVGAGLSGCEMAIHLAQEGKKVTLISPYEKLARDANIRQHPILMAQLEEEGVGIERGLRAAAIEPDCVVCTVKADGSEKRVAATSVVLAIGQRIDTELVDSLRNAAPWVSVVGDCNHVGDLVVATSEGYHAALDI